MKLWHSICGGRSYYYKSYYHLVFINWVDNVNRPLQRVSKDKVSGVSPTSEPMGQRSKDGLTLEMAAIFIIITDQLIGFCHDQMKKITMLSYKALSTQSKKQTFITLFIYINTVFFVINSHFPISLNISLNY